jgi:hypothetical protein
MWHFHTASTACHAVDVFIGHNYDGTGWFGAVLHPPGSEGKKTARIYPTIFIAMGLTCTKERLQSKLVLSRREVLPKRKIRESVKFRRRNRFWRENILAVEEVIVDDESTPEGSTQEYLVGDDDEGGSGDRDDERPQDRRH